MFNGRQVDTVLLAGGINRIVLHEGYAPSFKVLLTFRNKPAIQYVLDALAQTPQIGRIGIVGVEAELRPALKDAGAYTFVPSGERAGESAIRGLQLFREAPEVLFATADMPLLTSAAVSLFLQRCFENRSKGDVFVSAVDRSTFTGPYEGCPKRCTRFRGRSVCHGNLVVVDPSKVLETISEGQLNAIYRARKNPLRTAAAFGWRFVLAYLLGGSVLRFFTLEQGAAAASKNFRLRFVPILLDFPEIAVDIDEPADYEFVRRQLG